MTLLGRLFGGKQMAALSPGTTAPQFELSAVGGTKFSLKDALARGPVLAAFFKISVSNAYGLTNVPSAFWIGQDGQIEISSVGWSRADVEQMAQKAAEANGAALRPIFQSSEQIADFRAG
jgi:hypothetical protein